MSQTDVERRRSRRFNLALPIRILQLNKETVELAGETRNVSSVGAYFSVARDQFNPGVPVEFELTLEPDYAPGPVLLNCRGRIARVEGDEAISEVLVAASIDRYQFRR